MNKILKKKYLLPTLTCLLPFVISWVFYSRLPQRVAIHFDFNGLPDNFAPRAVAAFLMPTALLIGHLHTLFRLENEPKKDGVPRTIKSLLPWGMPLLSVLLQTSIVGYAVMENIDVSFYALLLCGVIMLLIGNYLPKCRHNYSFGIKTPWALASKDNWNFTHRIAGYIYMTCGLVMVICAFFGNMFVLLPAVVVMMGAPYLASYLYYRKRARSGPPEEGGSL